jgi:hypothetical protein
MSTYFIIDSKTKELPEWKPFYTIFDDEMPNKKLKNSPKIS